MLSDVKMILVEIHKGIVYDDGVVFIARAREDNDDSWYKGCWYLGQSITFSKLNQFMDHSKGSMENNFSF